MLPLSVAYPSLTARRYNPTDFGQSSLLMFNDDFGGIMQSSLDHPSPASSDGHSHHSQHSRASSVSSQHPHGIPSSRGVSPSPRMQVAQSFEQMSFQGSPNWGPSPLPSECICVAPNRCLDSYFALAHSRNPSGQAQSPPRLVMPDDNSPSLNIVPATPVRTAAANAANAFHGETQFSDIFFSLWRRVV